MKHLFYLLLLSPLFCKSQTLSYEDSLNNFIKKYVKDHEVVKGADTKYLQFYAVNKQYCVEATFNKKENSDWFLMNTSGPAKQEYRVYGTLSFMLQNRPLQLNVYQSKFLLGSKEYNDYLFIPFTDSTTGFETYGGGRYMDLKISDIQNTVYQLDFNKAYNPYCAYGSGYNCPVPPKENDLKVSIKAGEKSYLKH